MENKILRELIKYLKTSLNNHKNLNTKKCLNVFLLKRQRS